MRSFSCCDLAWRLRESAAVFKAAVLSLFVACSSEPAAERATLASNRPDLPLTRASAAELARFRAGDTFFDATFAKQMPPREPACLFWPRTMATTCA
jgi:hypothetical protein